MHTFHEPKAQHAASRPGAVEDISTDRAHRYGASQSSASERYLESRFSFGLHERCRHNSASLAHRSTVRSILCFGRVESSTSAAQCRFIGVKKR